MGYIERNIFLDCIFILLLYNVMYGLMLPAIQQIVFFTFMLIGTITGLIASILFVGCVAGSHIAAGFFGFEIETELDTATVKTIIGASLIVLLLFQVPIMMIPVGTGLAMPLFKIFALGTDPLSNILYFFVIIYIFITVISGLMMVLS